jgi:hypothetical protein
MEFVVVVKAFQRHLTPFDAMVTMGMAGPSRVNVSTKHTTDTFFVEFNAGPLTAVNPVLASESASRRAALWGRALRFVKLLNLLFQSCVGLWAVLRRMDAGLDPACEIWFYSFSRQRARTGPAIVVWIAGYVIVLVSMPFLFIGAVRQARRAAKMATVSTPHSSQAPVDGVVTTSDGAPEIPLEIIDQSPFSPQTSIPTRPNPAVYPANTPRLRLPPAIRTRNPNPSSAELIQSTHSINSPPPSPQPRKRRPNNRSRRSILPWAMLAFKLFWSIAFNIAFVEFTLVWNDVAGVHEIVGSSGQVMALLVALFTTVQFFMASGGLSDK